MQLAKNIFFVVVSLMMPKLSISQSDNTDIGIVLNLKAANIHHTTFSIKNQFEFGVLFRRAWNDSYGFSFSPTMKKSIYRAESLLLEDDLDMTHVSIPIRGEVQLMYNFWLSTGYHIDILGSMETASSYREDVSIMHGFNIGLLKYFYLDDNILLTPMVEIASSFSFNNLSVLQPIYLSSGVLLLWRIK